MTNITDNDEKICAIIVAYNNKSYLEKSINCLLNQTIKLYKVIIIDNASADGTEEMIKDKYKDLIYKDIIYIKLSKNSGSSGGFYVGIKVGEYIGCRWLWLLDHDAFATSTALENIIKTIKNIKNNEIQVFASNIMLPNGNIDIAFNNVIDTKSLNIKPIPLIKYKGVFEVELRGWTGMLVPVEIIKLAGYPLRDLFIDFDDYEYSFRLKQKNIKIFVVSSSIIIHPRGRPASAITPRFFYRVRNQIYFYKKYFGINIIFILKILKYILSKQISIIYRYGVTSYYSKLLWRVIVDGFAGRLGKYDI